MMHSRRNWSSAAASALTDPVQWWLGLASWRIDSARDRYRAVAQRLSMSVPPDCAERVLFRPAPELTLRLGWALLDLTMCQKRSHWVSASHWTRLGPCDGSTQQMAFKGTDPDCWTDELMDDSYQKFAPLHGQAEIARWGGPFYNKPIRPLGL